MSPNGQEIEGAWEKISPKRAEKLLNDTNTQNRKLRAGVVEKYAADMKYGKWLKNPQPIMFYEDGVLADGQHRLWAVVESGATVPFFIVRGVSKDVALNIDTGFGRGLVDNARIAGIEKPISHSIISMAVVLHFGTRQVGRGLSNAERLEIIERYEPHLTWVEERRPRKAKVSNGVIGAAIARAHMHERDLERLAEFCAILGGSIPKDPEADIAAHTFRNYVIGGDDLARDARDLFLKAMNATKYFMRRKSLTVIKGVKDEAYPLLK